MAEVQGLSQDGGVIYARTSSGCNKGGARPILIGFPIISGHVRRFRDPLIFQNQPAGVMK